MFASQHHETRIMNHIQFFSCIRTSSLTLQVQRQQNGPEKKTKDSFHQEYEPAAATKQRILFQRVSVLMSVVAAHLATMISSL